MAATRRLGALPISILCLCFGLASCASRSDRFAFSGTVQTDSAAVGSVVGGRVVAVSAADGQTVSAGTVIVRFDDRQQRAAYAAALAQAAQAHAALRDAEAGPRPADVAKAEAAAEQAQAAYRRAELMLPGQVASAQQAVHAAQGDVVGARAASATAAKNYARAQRLYAQGAIAAQALDSARAAAQSAAGGLATAESKLRAAQAQLDSVKSGAAAQDVEQAANAAAAAEANLTLVREGARPEQIAQARAAAQAADADVAATRARLDEMLVRSPARGVVNALDLHPGDLVAAGAPVAIIDEFGKPWVRVYVAQSDMNRVRVGAQVQVRSDALAGKTFAGSIEAIDTNAQFTPRDVQTASDRADLAFGVKVRIDDTNRELRGGTTVEVALP